MQIIKVPIIKCKYCDTVFFDTQQGLIKKNMHEYLHRYSDKHKEKRNV